MNKKLLNFFILIIALLVGLYFYKKYKVAPSMPFFTQKLINTNGDTTNLSNYNGKKLIVTYYASWCGNCLREMESLNEVKNSALSDVEVIAITDEDSEKLIRFSKKSAYPFTFLRLPKPFSEINIYSIPVTYILNQKGEIVYEQVGEINWKDSSFLNHVKSLL